MVYQAKRVKPLNFNPQSSLVSHCLLALVLDIFQTRSAFNLSWVILLEDAFNIINYRNNKDGRQQTILVTKDAEQACDMV